MQRYDKALERLEQVAELDDVALARNARAAVDHGVMSPLARRIFDELATRYAAEITPVECCEAETWSWWHFRDGQVDGYWIRCTAPLPHDEHEDSDTGLRWRDPVADDSEETR